MYTIYFTQHQANDLLTEVFQMRNLQKEYFKTRNFKVLSNSKKQEAKVDGLIQQYLFSASQDKPNDLFSDLQPDPPTHQNICNCNPDYSTGETMQLCCNNCGKIKPGQALSTIFH